MSGSFDAMRNIFRRDAEAIMASVSHPRYATVASCDPANHAVKLLLMPEGLTTGWVPDASAFATSGGFGVVAPLTMGDQVVCLYAHGDDDNPVIVGRLFSAADLPPVSPATGKAVQPGEMGIFTDGAWAHFHGGIIDVQATTVNVTASGTVNVKATNVNITANVLIDGNLTVTGDQNIEGTKDGSTGALRTKGEILDLAGSHGSLDDLRTVHNDHLHGGVQEGGADTTGPNLTK
jgi:phage baseplate assembly protein V